MSEASGSGDEKKAEGWGQLSVEEVVRRFGGIRPMAAKLSIPVTTVQGWKNRGHIPENRHDVIVEAARRLGINFSADQPSDRSSAASAEAVPGESDISPSEVKKSAPGEGEAAMVPGPVSKGSSSVSWLALILAVVALVVAMGGWLSANGPGEDPGIADLTRRLNDLTAKSEQTSTKVAAPLEKISRLQRDLAELASRVGSADTKPAALGSIETAIKAMSGRVERLEARTIPKSPDLEKLRADLEGGLGAALKGAKSDLQTEIATLVPRISAIEKGIRGIKVGGPTLEKETVERDLSTLRASLAVLSAELARVSSRVSELGTRAPGKAAPGIALLVFAGQLEAAVRSGVPYRRALERVRSRSDKDAIILGALATLEEGADVGAPTIESLRLGFRDLRHVLAAGPAPTAGRDMPAEIWARIKGTISLRRVGEASKSPLSMAENALGKRDIVGALKAIEGFGKEVAAWRAGARSYVANNAALKSLEDRVIFRSASVSMSGKENSAKADGK